MSWITSPHMYRSARFHAERKHREPTAPDEYVQPTPEWMLIKYMYSFPTGDVIRRRGFYYLDLARYTADLVGIAKDVIEKHGEKYVADIAVFGRRYGLIKDTPLIIAHLLNSENIYTVLKEYPPHLVLRFIEIGRKAKQIAGGYGRRKKRAVTMWLNMVFRTLTPKAEYYAMRYHSELADILRLTHPKPITDTQNNLYKWILRKGEPPTERLKIYTEILSNKYPVNIAIEKAIEYRLPYELFRSTISLKKLTDEQYYRVMLELASGATLGLSIKSIYNRLGLEKTAEIIRKRIESIPLHHLYRAVFYLAEKHMSIAEEIDRIARRRGRVKEFAESLAKLGAKPRITLLIDISDSMAPLKNTTRMLAYVLKDLAVETYTFYSNWTTPVIKEAKIHTIEDAINEIKPGGGTPLAQALRFAEKKAEENNTTLVVITDEMENASHLAERGAYKPRVETIVINPTPYSAEHIVKEKGKIIGVAGATLDAVKACLQYIQLRNIVQTEGTAKLHEVIEQLI